jgi:hypothetical protein
MATHDYIISNASGAAVRADLNNALAAIVSNNSNASSPSTTYAYQWWADTTTGQLKLRNSANNAWITIFELDGTMLMEDGTAAAPGLAFASDLNTGFFRSAADKINFATGGVERLEIGSSEVVFNDGSNDVDFRVESNGQSHMLFVDGGNDRVEIAGKLSLVGGTDVRMEFGTSGTTGTNDRNHIRADGDNLKFNTCDNGAHIFEENGVERMKIDSSGRLLVGTTTEGFATFGDNLTIADSGHCGVTIRSGTSSQGNIYFSDGSSGGSEEYEGIIQYLHDVNAMAFGVNNGGEKLRIDSSGNVLIGTSVSNASYRLTINDPGDSLIAIRSDAAADATSQVLDFGVGTGNRSSTNLTGAIQATIHSQSGGTLKSDLSFFTNAGNSITERLRIDSSGSVGIGISNPGDYHASANSLVTSSGITLANTSQGSIFFADSATGTGEYVGQLNYDHPTNSMSFITNNSERMRLDSSGNVLVAVSNTTKTSEGFRIENGGQPNITRGTDGTFISFYHTSGSVIGSIQNNGGTGTLFNTSSDYRLKENVVDIADGITRVKQLSPKRFNFIADDIKIVDGFIAHEAQTVVPEAVTGTKDEVDADGNAVMQGIDQSKLVPLLTAALQEAITKIETLETKVAALEAG